MTMMNAAARGNLTLASADPAEAPRLRFNYLDNDGDMQTFREAIRLTRDLLTAPAFAPFAGAELDPGAAVQSDAALDDWIRSRVATAYHPSCTCRMGQPSDPAAVVGPDLAVHGLRNLRIADASVMPQVVTANTNATTIMIGERAADICLGLEPLPRSTAPYSGAEARLRSVR
jgi:choline dehydrogenase